MLWTEKARQQAAMATGRELPIAAHAQYVQQMEQYLSEADKLYARMLERAPQSPQSHLSVGRHYQRVRGFFARQLAQYCTRRADASRARISQIRDQVAALTRNTTLERAERVRRQRQLRRQESRLAAQIPRWRSAGEKFQRQATAYAEQTLKNYEQALALAEGDTKVDVLVALGAYWLANNDLDKAQKYLTDAQKLAPKGYESYRLLSVLRRMEGRRMEQPDQRIAKFQDALNVLEYRLNELPHEQTGPKARTNAGMRLRLISQAVEVALDLARLEADKKDKHLGKAEEYLEQLRQQLGESALVRKYEGQIAWLKGHGTEAIKAFSAADRLANERDAEVKLSLAQLYLNRRQVGAAKQAAEAALQLAPRDVRALLLAGQIALREGQYGEALTYAQRLLSMQGQSDNPQGLRIKLNALIGLGRLSEADAVAAAIQATGAEFNWDLAKAQILLTQQREDEAKALLEKVLRDEPGNRDASILLASMYDRQGQVDQAKQVVDRALAKNADDMGLKRMKELLGITDPEVRRKRREELEQEALQERREASLEAAQEVKDPYMRQVLLFQEYLRREEFDKAREYLLEAEKIDPLRVNGIMLRFAILREDWALARQCVEKAQLNNLDGVNGHFRAGELANGLGWYEVMKGNLDKAREQFARSAEELEAGLREYPNDSDMRGMLAEAYFWLDRSSDAETQIRKALELSPNNAYALRAQVAMDWQRITRGEAPAEQEFFTEFQRRLVTAARAIPWDKWLKDKMDQLRTLAAEQQQRQEDISGDAQAAVQRREKRRAEDPNDVANIMRLAWLYENREEVKDLDKAGACYEEALTRQPALRWAEAYEQFGRRTDRAEQVEAFMQGLAEKLAGEGNGDGYSLLGLMNLNKGKTDAARAALEKAVQISDNADKRLDMALFCSRINDPNGTIEWARKTLQADPTRQQDRRARALLIGSLMNLRQWDACEQEIRQYQQTHAEDITGQLLEGRLELARRDYSAAERVFTQLLDRNPENLEALGGRARVYIATWQLEKARADLEQMKRVDRQRFGFEGMVRLVKLYCELGRPREAVELTREAISQAARLQVGFMERLRVQLTPYLSSGLEPSEYEALLTWAANLNRDYWGWQYEQGELQLREGNASAAVRAFQSALDALSQGDARLQAAVRNRYLEALWQAQRYGELVRELDELLKASKEPAPAWATRKAMALYKLNQRDAAFRLFKGIVERQWDHPVTLWELARRMLTAADAQEMIQLSNQNERADASKASAWKLVRAVGLYEAKRPQEGYRLYQELAEGTDDEAKKGFYYLFAGQSLIGAGLYEEAVQAFQEALKYQPKQPAILNNLAFLLSERLARPQEGLEYIQRAIQEAPGNPDILDTYGVVLYRLGRHEEALSYLSQSVWVQEMAASRYHLALVLQSLGGREGEVRRQLNRALMIVGDDAELKKEIQTALEGL